MNNSEYDSAALAAGTDEHYMRRCLQLARQGENGAAPNPMVGAVIVCQGRIIGEGYHVHCGQAHAEVNAINSVRPEDRPLLQEATIYVSLEPCSHYGRTPPCAKLIVDRHIPRVVVGCEDPFAKVHGRGIQMLCDAGVEVTVGVLEEECRALNKKFITFHTHHRPYITLKWARSKDGFLDRWREPLLDTGNAASLSTQPTEGGTEESTSEAAQQPAILSTSLTQMAVHHQRARHQAILVGHSTLHLDRPSLTVRAWDGADPLPVVLGRVAEGELPRGWQCFADIDLMLEALFRQNVQSLLVEGGARTLQSFIDAGLWDEAWEELSATMLQSGVPAPRMPYGVELEIVQKFGVPFSHWTNS